MPLKLPQIIYLQYFHLMLNLKININFRLAYSLFNLRCNNRSTVIVFEITHNKYKAIVNYFGMLVRVCVWDFLLSELFHVELFTYCLNFFC
jgi:hypothetical protein